MEQDTSRVVVQAYLPAYQRKEWDEHADELDMSRSEFVRTMVQAGRRVFDNEVEIGSDTHDRQSGETASTTAINGGTDLETRVIDILESKGPLQWDDLLRQVSGDIENRLEETLQELQEQNRIRYSGRAGGYVCDGGDQ